MICLSWNIRCLGARLKRSALRKIIHSHDPMLIAIQETKLKEISPKLIRMVWNCNRIKRSYAPYVGNSGGFLTIWSQDFPPLAVP